MQCRYDGCPTPATRQLGFELRTNQPGPLGGFVVDRFQVESCELHAALSENQSPAAPDIVLTYSRPLPQFHHPGQTTITDHIMDKDAS